MDWLLIVTLCGGAFAWLVGTDAGRDLLAVAFEGQGAVLVDQVVMPGGSRAIADADVRALWPYVVRLEAGERPWMVLAADAGAAALAARGGRVATIECLAFPHRVVRPAPGTWAVVVLPGWLAARIGRARCAHGSTTPHVET